MTTVFTGNVAVAYSQAYVEAPGAALVDMADTFRGQTNGLCGAADPGVLFLVTGLHTGVVPFAVEVSDDEPVLPDAAWQDVVEVSFSTSEPVVTLLGWAGGSADAISLGSSGSFRVRYCVSDFSRGRDGDTRGEDDEVLDRYLLQFWPAAAAPDVVLRTSGPDTRYWHDYARSLPPPPTAAERAAAEEASRRREATERERARVAMLTRHWGGRPPSPRLEALGGNVVGVARSDRDLLDAFEALPGPRQRELARWLARRAFEIAEIDRLEWVAPALAAMDQGAPLPDPFTDPGAVRERIRPSGPATATVSEIASARASSSGSALFRGPIHRPSFAVNAIFSAVAEDPLRALVDTFAHATATANERRGEVVAELRGRLAR